MSLRASVLFFFFFWWKRKKKKNTEGRRKISTDRWRTLPWISGLRWRYILLYYSLLRKVFIYFISFLSFRFSLFLFLYNWICRRGHKQINYTRSILRGLHTAAANSNIIFYFPFHSGINLKWGQKFSKILSDSTVYCTVLRIYFHP